MYSTYNLKRLEKDLNAPFFKIYTDSDASQLCDYYNKKSEQEKLNIAISKFYF